MTSNKSKQSLEAERNIIINETTMKNSLLQLVVQIKQHQKVKQHSSLHCPQWNKGCYNLLADLIFTDLSERMSDSQLLQTGSSISAKTLQKIVEGNYVIKLPLDPRRINTLNKLAFFIGYKNWDDFLLNLNKAKSAAKSTLSEAQILNETIQKALTTEFAAYLNLPEIPKEFLSEIFIEGNHAFNKIMEVLLQQQQQGCIISNPYNCSTYELLECSIEKVNDSYAQINTLEYWDLCWWSTEKQQYVRRYKNISKHVYILHKVDGVWKVKTNASTADFLQAAVINQHGELSWNQAGISESPSFSAISLNQN